MAERKLYEALGVGPGVTALVGAGGKTSAMLKMARELRLAGRTVAVTTTTHILPPPEALCGPMLFDPDGEALDGAARRGICAVGKSLDARGKVEGVDEEMIYRLAARFEYVLAEADGSRRMPCKVPAPHEPVIPRMARRVIGVMGLSALGRPLEEACFRLEIARARLDAPPGAIITAHTFARIAAAPWGLQRGVEGRAFTLLLNQSDACPEAAGAADICAAALPGARVCLSALRLCRWICVKEDAQC